MIATETTAIVASQAGTIGEEMKTTMTVILTLIVSEICHVEPVTKESGL